MDSLFCFEFPTIRIVKGSFTNDITNNLCNRQCCFFKKVLAKTVNARLTVLWLNLPFPLSLIDIN